MSDITKFEFNGHGIRVVTIDGEPWFVAADVCRVLDMDVEKGTHRYLQRLDQAERRVATRETFAGIGHRPLTVISESGLYKLILRSSQPQAKPFQDWVTKEVLPAIRKDGAYVMGEEKVRTGELSEDEFVLRALEILKAKVERLRAEKEAAEAKAEAAEAKQDEMRVVFGRANHTVQRVARTLGEDINRNKVKESLMKAGFLFQTRGGTYRAYSKHSHLFYEKIDDHFGHVEIFCTAAGKEKMAELYHSGLMILKAGARKRDKPHLYS